MNINNIQFKTQPLIHQKRYLEEFGGREYFANLCEQGTGKSWMFINEAALLWDEGKIDSVLILAPNGVHENWTRPVVGQIEQHIPNWVMWRSLAWSTTHSQKAIKERDEFVEDNQHRVLRFYGFNWEALQGEKGQAEIIRYLNKCSRTLVILDESDAIKDPAGLRAKFLNKLKKTHGHIIKYRRISTGTPINNAPFDAFSQFSFLNPDILETTSFRAFKTEYSKTLPPNHGLIKGIVGKKVKMDPVQIKDVANYKQELMRIIDKNGRIELIEKLYDAIEADDSGNSELFVERLKDLKSLFNPESQHPDKVHCCKMIDGITYIISSHIRRMTSALNPNRIPLLVERDKAGAPIYRNLEKLANLIAPYSYRVLRSECLDLPDKIYKTLFFHLTKEQAEVYRMAEEECRIMYEGDVAPFSRLTAVTKLSQITSGYYLHPASDDAVRIVGGNPKLELLVQQIKSCVERGEKAIIWARYTTEIDDIAEALNNDGITNAKYYGKTKKKDRLEIIDQFEQTDELISIKNEVEVWKKSGLSVFIGNQRAGGTGITLVAASSVHYYSNSFSLRDRLQSEDRAMRIGQTKNVTYYNYAGIGTIDEYVILCLLNKVDVAYTIVDKHRAKDLFTMGNKLLTA